MYNEKIIVVYCDRVFEEGFNNNRFWQIPADFDRLWQS